MASRRSAPHAQTATWVRAWRSRRGPCSYISGRSTSTDRGDPSSPRTSTTWPMLSSSLWSVGAREGGTRDDAGREGDAAQASDRPFGGLDHLRARPRHDLAHVPRTARRHHGSGGRDRGRWRERDHDEQGDDPGRRVGLLADDLARVAALGEREPRRRPSRGRADRGGGGGARARRRRRRAVHGARRGDRARDDRHPGERRARVCGSGHAVHRRGGVPDHVCDGRGAQGAVRVRVPAAQRAPVCRARRGHREDELAGRPRVLRQARRDRERHPGGPRGRLASGGQGTALADAGGGRGGRDRLLGWGGQFYATPARGEHPGPRARDPRAVGRGQGIRGAFEGVGGPLMRAAFMTDVNAVEVRDTDAPRLEPGGAILKVEACGICGTDARTFFNGDPRAPSPWVLGHEPVGILEEVGPDADLPPGVAKGDRVFLGSILTCGECRWCLDGFQNLCEYHLLYGFDPFPRAYAEGAGAPPIATKNLIPLPEDLASDLATVADPFACALNGVEMLDVQLGDTVVILGTGPIGCWQAVMCRDRGASRIYMTDVKADRLKVALDVVGHVVDGSWVTGEGDDGVGEVLSRTDGRGAERVSVAAPSKQAQQAALEMAAKRARIVYFAGLPKHDPVSPLDMNQLHYKELAMLGAYGATHRQYPITMDYLDRKQEELARVVTHRFPLEEIGQAFETIRAGTGLKMVILP